MIAVESYLDSRNFPSPWFAAVIGAFAYLTRAAGLASDRAMQPQRLQLHSLLTEWSSRVSRTESASSQLDTVPCPFEPFPRTAVALRP